jgi:Arc/MetJ-type ribon-helix-helix transcriptional regulator
MIIVTALLPRKLVEMLDELVRIGLYPSRSDAIRQAVRDLIRREWPNFMRRSRAFEGLGRELEIEI